MQIESETFDLHDFTAIAGKIWGAKRGLSAGELKNGEAGKTKRRGALFRK